MKIPFAFAVTLSVLEIVFCGYKLSKNDRESASFGLGMAVGIWIVILYSFLERHIAWNW